MDVEIVARVAEHGHKRRRLALIFIGIAAVIAATEVGLQARAQLDGTRSRAMSVRFAALHHAHDAVSQSLRSLVVFTDSDWLRFSYSASAHLNSKDEATRTIGTAEAAALTALGPLFQSIAEDVQAAPRLPEFANAAVSSSVSDQVHLRREQRMSESLATRYATVERWAAFGLLLVAVATALFALSTLAPHGHGHISLIAGILMLIGSLCFGLWSVFV